MDKQYPHSMMPTSLSAYGSCKQSWHRALQIASNLAHAPLDPFSPLLVLQGQSTRERWWKLIAPALNFSHKAACAVVFGMYGLLVSSWGQLAWLVALQVGIGR